MADSAFCDLPDDAVAARKAVMATLADAEASGVAVAQKLGLPADATADQLRTLPVEKLVGVSRARPVVDGRLMTEGSEQGFARGDQAPAPLIIGANSWEASLLPKGGYAAYAAGLSPAVRAAYPEDAADPAKRVTALREAVAMLATRIGDAVAATPTPDARRR